MRPGIGPGSTARRVAARARTLEPVERATPAKDAIGRTMTASGAAKLIERLDPTRSGRRHRRPGEQKLSQIGR